MASVSFGEETGWRSVVLESDELRVVVLPDKDAGCSLEQSCPADKLEAHLNRFPVVGAIPYLADELKGFAQTVVDRLKAELA